MSSLIRVCLVLLLAISSQTPVLAATYSCGSTTPPISARVEASSSQEAMCRFVEMNKLKPDPKFPNDRCRAASDLFCTEMSANRQAQAERHKACDAERQACVSECRPGPGGDMSKRVDCLKQCQARPCTVR